MDNPLIYWKEYDNPVKFTDALTGAEINKSGEYVCNDGRVEKYLVWGYMKSPPQDAQIEVVAGLFMKDGTRVEFTPTLDSADQWSENLIAQATEYLENLNNK